MVGKGQLSRYEGPIHLKVCNYARFPLTFRLTKLSSVLTPRVTGQDKLIYLSFYCVFSGKSIRTSSLGHINIIPRLPALEQVEHLKNTLIVTQLGQDYHAYICFQRRNKSRDQFELKRCTGFLLWNFCKYELTKAIT